MEHQNFLKKDVPRVSIMQLTQLTDVELTTMLGDAYTLFAFRFFHEINRNPNLIDF